MTYSAFALGSDAKISVEAEGLRIGQRYIDYSDVAALVPLNHRVLVDTLAGERIEISMLGFSYDGFWAELLRAYTNRCLESLFVEGEAIMSVEGDYETPNEKGRARIELFPDSVCILPPTCGAVRIPLCFTECIALNGYAVNITTAAGERYTVGRMGYDTKPFAERAQASSDRIKKERRSILSGLKNEVPFTQTGLFRTTTPELYWQAAYGKGGCALELFTKEDSATYLYSTDGQTAVFPMILVQALEAVGPHREIIYITDEQLGEKPLYKMSVARCRSVREMRARFAGRLIHNSAHAERLREFLGS